MADNTTLDWNDAIEDDGNGISTLVLPEGDYVFEVTSFERGRFPGGQKLPPCNKAALTFKIESDLGTAFAKTDLMLCKSVEWKLSAFFRCIGQKKHGERLVMNWDKVVGSHGKAHFKPRDYTDKNGNERQANDVSYFIDYDEKFFKDMNSKENEWMPVPEESEDEIPFN